MELQTANFYIFVWLALAGVFAYVLRKAYRKGKAEAEESEKEYFILEDGRFLWRLGIGVGLVVLYAMVMPFRSDIANYNGNADFTNEFKKVTEEDRYRGGIDLSDEARAKRLEELREQNEEISEDIAKESDIDDTTKGDNQ